MVEKWGLERLPNDVGFIPNVSHYCRKLAFFMSLKPKLCTQECACAYTWFGPRTQVVAHVRELWATLVILFPK